MVVFTSVPSAPCCVDTPDQNQPTSTIMILVTVSILLLYAYIKADFRLLAGRQVRLRYNPSTKKWEESLV